MSAGNDDLHPILSRIHETLGDALEWLQRIKGEVEAVKEAVVEGTEAIQEAIHDSIQAEAELQMMEHVADVEAIEPQISAEQERIESEKEELDERLEQIDQRYQRRHQELDDTAAERVRDLGDHIFEIDEGEFERGIEGPFTDHVTTTWATLWDHNESVEDERREAVEMGAGDAVQSIHTFVDQQRELLKDIDAHRTEFEGAPREPTSLQVPYYVVTMEVEGRTERHVVVPSEVEEGDGATSVSLRSLPGLDDLVSPTDLANPRTEHLSAAELDEAAASYRDDAPPLLSYGDAVEDALGEGVDVTVEGGAN